MRKRYIGMVGGAITAVLALGACGGSTTVSPTTAASTMTTPSTTSTFPIPLAAKPGGIGDRTTGIGNAAGGGWLGWAHDARQQAIDTSVGMRQPSTLTDANWASLQPNLGESLDAGAEANLDGMLSDMHASGQAAGLLLTYTPEGARPQGCAEPNCLPASGKEIDQAFGRFAAIIARKALAAGIPADKLAIVPGNEPNIAPSANPSRSAALTTAAYRAVKTVNPGITVVSPGITYTGDESTLAYIKEFVDAGALFDAFGYHPYPNGENMTGPPTQALNLIPKINELLPKVNGQRPAIWLTEISYATTIVKPFGRFVTTDQQQEYIAEVIRYWAKDLLLGPLFVYQSRDEAKTTGNPVVDNGHDEDARGLYAFDGQPKPAGTLVAEVNRVIQAGGNQAAVLKAAA